MAKTTPIADRFWSKVDTTSTPDGCWLWTGYVLPNGYPRFSDGRSGYAHRASWELANGVPIPAGLTVDHLCNTPQCVRPDHLQVATQRANILRSGNPAAKNARKTHCDSGHDLSDAYVTTRNGTLQRACRTCTLGHQRRARARKASAVLT